MQYFYLQWSIFTVWYSSFYLKDLNTSPTAVVSCVWTCLCVWPQTFRHSLLMLNEAFHCLYPCGKWFMLLRCLLGSPWDGNDQKEAQENNCIFILALFKEESIEKQFSFILTTRPRARGRKQYLFNWFHQIKSTFWAIGTIFFGLSHFKPSVSLSFVLIVTDHHHSLCIQTAGCRLIWHS